MERNPTEIALGVVALREILDAVDVASAVASRKSVGELLAAFLDGEVAADGLVVGHGILLWRRKTDIDILHTPVPEELGKDVPAVVLVVVLNAEAPLVAIVVGGAACAETGAGGAESVHLVVGLVNIGVALRHV